MTSTPHRRPNPKLHLFPANEATLLQLFPANLMDLLQLFPTNTEHGVHLILQGYLGNKADYLSEELLYPLGRQPERRPHQTT